MLTDGLKWAFFHDKIFFVGVGPGNTCEKKQQCFVVPNDAPYRARLMPQRLFRCERTSLVSKHTSGVWGELERAHHLGQQSIVVKKMSFNFRRKISKETPVTLLNPFITNVIIFKRSKFQSLQNQTQVKFSLRDIPVNHVIFIIVDFYYLKTSLLIFIKSILTEKITDDHGFIVC